MSSAKKRETGDGTRAIRSIDVAEDETGVVAKYVAGFIGAIMTLGSFGLYGYLTIQNGEPPGFIASGVLMVFAGLGLFGIIPRRMAWFFTFIDKRLPGGSK